MTNRQLLDQLKDLTEDQLNKPVSIFLIRADETHSVLTTELVDDEEVQDGRFCLVVDGPHL